MSLMTCEHGQPLYGDKCDQCWDIEMSLVHCRRCGACEYYSSDFKHEPNCEIRDVPVEKLPNWRELPGGHARDIPKPVTE